MLRCQARGSEASMNHGWRKQLAAGALIAIELPADSRKAVVALVEGFQPF